MVPKLKVDKIARNSGTPEFTIPTADGAANTILQTDGSGVLSFTPNVINSSNVTYTGNSVLDIKNSGTASSIKLYCESSNAHYTEIKSGPHSGATQYTLTLPNAPPATNGLALTATTAGVASWAAAGGGKILQCLQATKTDTQTLTNKTLTSPTITGPTVTGGATIDSVTTSAITTNSITSNGSNADLSLQPSGTGDVLISALRINGTTLDSSDSSKITIAEALDVTGAVTITSGTITGITDLTVADGGTGASSLTDNAVLTGTGTSAITAEGNLSFNGSTLAVTGAATVSTTLGVTGASTLDGVTVTDNTISSNASNANLEISANGSGKVSISGLLWPTSDGSNGQALVTDGAGTLSFGTVSGASPSDDTTAVAKADKLITTTARVVDAWHETFLDSALYYVVSSDHVNEQISVNKISVCHNDTTSFYNVSGTSNDGTATTAFSTDISNSMVRLKATGTGATGKLSYLKVGLGDNSSAATAGNTEIVINSDVDSASESLDSFAHASYRGAKYFISVNNDTKTEVGNIEAIVVHDGSDAWISTYGELESGNNSLITLTAAISGSNVVVSAAGGEPNLRVTVHAIRLKDTMVSDDGTYDNTESIAPVTVSSTATEVDTLVEETVNGAIYYFVSKNASEGEYAVNEVYVAAGSGDVGIASGPWVSTKGTNQLEFAASYKDDLENTVSITAASTSGGSTTVSAYRINALAK